MWKYFIRPLFFLFDPEIIHDFLINWTKVLGGAGSPDMRFTSPLLEKKVFGINFPNPVGLAAGFDKNVVQRQCPEISENITNRDRLFKIIEDMTDLLKT